MFDRPEDRIKLQNFRKRDNIKEYLIQYANAVYEKWKWEKKI